MVMRVTRGITRQCAVFFDCHLKCDLSSLSLSLPVNVPSRFDFWIALRARFPPVLPNECFSLSRADSMDMADDTQEAPAETSAPEVSGAAPGQLVTLHLINCPAELGE